MRICNTYTPKNSLFVFYYSGHALFEKEKFFIAPKNEKFKIQDIHFNLQLQVLFEDFVFILDLF